MVSKTLYLLVLDYDRFSRDDPIGEVCLPLSELDLGAGLTLWKTLTPCKGAAVSTHTLIHVLARCTRQLSYRKEDRAMRPIYGCPEKF